MMRLHHLLLLFSFSLLGAQNPPPAPQTQPSAPAVAPANSPDPAPLLTKIEQETQALNADIGKLRIDRWKVDSGTRQHATQNAASIERNISAALPELINAVRSTPKSLAANFKLYRNLNALYDAVAGLGESVGAFGRSDEFQVIAPHVTALDNTRRSYADLVQQMSASADSRIAADQEAFARAAAAAVQAPPKKIVVVEDDQPPPPTKKKKVTPKKAPATSTSDSTSTPK
jgi:hypothetical protein